MADTYIDYMECVEYGQYFLTEGQALVGRSPLVNMEHVLTRMRAAVAEVEAELDKTGIKGSELRGGRTGIQDTAAAGRVVLERFYHQLRTLPEDTRFDFEAFFPGHVLGNVSRLKPADLLGKINQVLRGFAAPANAVPQISAEWQQALTQARDALAAALAGKSDARVQSILANGGLAGARKRFLAFYHGVAKNAVRALLNELGRGQELRLFFLDLQVNESRQPGDDDAPADEPVVVSPETSPEATPEASGRRTGPRATA